MSTPTLPQTKTCTLCKQEKPLDGFYLAPKTGQRETRCRVCRADYQRSRAHESRAANRKSYAKHREARQVRIRQWALDHREEMRRIQREWSHANPIKVRQKRARRVARWKGVEICGDVDYTLIIERDGGICYLCGLVIDPSDLEFDHVVPMSRGGAHSNENIRITHALCNARKFTKLPEEMGVML